MIYLGLFIFSISVLYIIYLFINIMISGVNIPGYFSTIAAILLLGGIQLISIGVVGEYIGRIYYEVKARLNILFKLQIFQVLKMMRRIPMYQS